MVEYRAKQLDGIFGALSDPTRRALVERLCDGPATIGELAEPHEMSFQAVSKHLQKLEEAGLVHRRKDGRRVVCEVDLGPMQKASSWIDEQRRFWEVRLDRLGTLLEGPRDHPKKETDHERRDRPHGDEND